MECISECIYKCHIWKLISIISGQENKCPQGKAFDFQDHIQDVTEDIQVDEPAACPFEPVLPVNTTKLEKVIKELPSRSSCSATMSYDTAALDMSLYTYRDRKRRMLDSP